jgi:DNA-binding transcriptional MocR family regulator
MPHNDFSRHPLSWQPDPSSLSRPRYLSLAAKLAQDIESGVLAPGTCLPPQRELADWLDLNFTTVTRAYNACRERNLVYGVTGRGTFVAPLPGGTDGADPAAFDLGAVHGFPELGADILMDTARTVLNRDRTRQLFSYAERGGIARHRAAGALWISRLGRDVPPGQTVVFPGVQNALVTLMLAFFDIGDTLAVDEFTYGNLIEAARLARIRLTPVEGDGEGMLPDALEKAAAGRGLKGVYLMPTCSNPLTATMSTRRKNDLAAVIRRHGLLVLEDDAALEPNGSGTFFGRLPEQTFHLTGSTRFLAAGLRTAFAACPERHLGRLLGAHHRLTIKASALDAEIMSELILSGRAEKLLARKIRRAEEMNSVFGRIFPQENRRARDTPFFRTLELPCTRRNGPEIERELLAEGVRACHSWRFSVRKNPPREFLRLSLCSIPGKSEFVRALKTVAGWMDRQRRRQRA